MAHSVDNRGNWKNVYSTYVDRWHDKYSLFIDVRDNRRSIWNGTCIDCQSATEKGKGWRNCDSCFTPLRIENAHGTVTFLFENAPEWAFSKRRGLQSMIV